MPKEPIANLNFREELIRLGCSSKETAQDLWIMCKRDPLFYINSFCWTYDPRPKKGRPTILPFITYDFQDEAIFEILDAMRNGEDLGIEKSRDMTATWTILQAFEYEWHFEDLMSFLLVSRKEEYVWKANDPKTLFWKIEFLLKYQPLWLQPMFNSAKLQLHNTESDSTIDGESTTGDVARGDRRTAIMLDEFGSVKPDEADKVLDAVPDAANCCIFNSTPKGAANAFYRKITQAGVRKLRFHWSIHPEKNQGLYTSYGGAVKILDTAYKFPDDYEFITSGDWFFGDGAVRSPWFDKECKRRGSRKTIAQELEIDYQASDSQFFDVPVLDRLARETFPPIKRGEADFDLESLEFRSFRQDAKGKLSLWIELDGKGMPKRDDYAIGADISTGTGASNSTLEIGLRRTGEKVGEIATPHMLPEKFARLAVAVAYWFSNKDGAPAFLIWEDNGPGNAFGKTVVDLGFRNFFYRQNERSTDKKSTDVPGWWSSPETKRALLTDYRNALANGTFVERSRETLEECRYYVYHLDGVEHSSALNSDDPSGARSNHGDRVVGSALLYKAIKEFSGVLEEEKQEQEAGINSFAARRAKHEAKKKEQESWR